MSFTSSADLLRYHRGMLADRVRVDRYRAAIQAAVGEGDVVLDLGCGTGLLSFFACQAGARQVYAIDLVPDMVELASRLAAHNGFSDRIAFINEVSTRVDIPEPVDVIVTETLWNFGLGEGIIRYVTDARDRFLRDGGKIVPSRFRLEIAPIESAHCFRVVDEWVEDLHGLDFTPVRALAANNIQIPGLDSSWLLAPPVQVASIDLGADPADLDSQASVTVSRSGTLHGVGGWFEAELGSGIELSNAPPNPAPSWNQAFFPLEQPLDVAEGDTLQISLLSVREGSAWAWRVEHQPAGNEQPASRRDQSSLRGYVLSETDLLKASESYTPTLSRRGEAERFTLALLDGSRSISSIEQDVGREFPDVFRTPDEVSGFVRDLVGRAT